LYEETLNSPCLFIALFAMIFVLIALICVGLVLVVLSADQAIHRLLHLAKYLRLSEFTVSFVLAGVIAILPELSIGVLAALEGNPSLGFGVILGSNVADLTLVIGIVVLFSGKFHLDSGILKNMRMSFLAVVLPVILFIVDGEISRLDGVILVAAFLFYVFMLLRTKHDGAILTEKRPKRLIAKDTAIFLGSIAILLIGGTLITNNSETLSMTLGLPLFVVGVVVAVGTCLPELAFAIRSCNKKHCGIGLGNILGNVLADSMLTIGVIALIEPIKPAFVAPPLFTGVFMVVSALIVYILSRDGMLDRKDGLLLVSIFVIFLIAQSIIVGI
jgi:cation:H+ antiporter